MLNTFLHSINTCLWIKGCSRLLILAFVFESTDETLSMTRIRFYIEQNGRISLLEYRFLSTISCSLNQLDGIYILIGSTQKSGPFVYLIIPVVSILKWMGILWSILGRLGTTPPLKGSLVRNCMVKKSFSFI